MLMRDKTHGWVWNCKHAFDVLLMWFMNVGPCQRVIPWGL